MSSDHNYLPATQKYIQRRTKYEKFSSDVCRIVSMAMEDERINFHSIDARAKEIESFDKKARKENKDGSLKYPDPLEQITDLAGVRIITQTLKEVKAVTALLDSGLLKGSFHVLESEDVGQKRLESGNFGYKSIHYLVRYADDRAKLFEFSKYKDLICEIQVRTILQHAWAEIEHDVQYKTQSELPASIRSKFLSLAGLLEIGDREFQALQDEDRRLKQVILDELQEDLTRDVIDEPVRSAETGDGGSTNKNVRQLLMSGKYNEAIEIYDEKLNLESNNYTLYMGRAKANFLIGDVAAAHHDLDSAEAIKSDDPAIARLRERIVEGKVRVILQPQDERSASQLTAEGNAALQKGEGNKAYGFYSKAQEVGASFPFSTFNKAMACIVAEDYFGAELNYGKLRKNSGTPMEINVRALEAITHLLLGQDAHAEIGVLQQCISDKEDYSYELSPLERLRSGIEASPNGAERLDRVSSVFTILKGSNAH